MLRCDGPLTGQSMRRACLLLGGVLFLTFLPPAMAQSQKLTDMLPEVDPLVPTAEPGRGINIFDPAKGEQITPIQKAVEVFVEREKERQRRCLVKTENLLTYEYELVGETEDQIYREAMVRSLKSSAARLYFGNFILLGRDVLEPYLYHNGAPFIVSNDVLERRDLSRELIQMRLRVGVNLDTFYRDLWEKRFIAAPNLRPIASVHLREVIEGRPDTSADARSRIDLVMEQNLYRVFSDKMRKPGLDVDLSGSPGLLREARGEAQRHDVDVLVTGTVAVRPIREETIYYDDHFFQEAAAELKLYRVDTGEMLIEVDDRYSANGASVGEATDKALNELLIRMSQKIADHLRGMWGKTMLEKGNYRVLVSGVRSDQKSKIYAFLRTLSDETEIYEKTYYGDVLVVNLVAPALGPDQLESFLRDSSEPQFDVHRVSKREFALELL